MNRPTGASDFRVPYTQPLLSSVYATCDPVHNDYSLRPTSCRPLLSFILLRFVCNSVRDKNKCQHSFFLVAKVSTVFCFSSLDFFFNTISMQYFFLFVENIQFSFPKVFSYFPCVFFF